MHVAIYGAGALGAVYGVRLAALAHVTVSFVVRPARVAAGASLAIEKVGGPPTTLAAPTYAARIPGDADVVLLAVRTDDLAALTPSLASSNVPIVVLTPMMPTEYATMKRAYGDRVLAAMPSVIAYRREDGVFRYWLPPAVTRIDEPRAAQSDAVVVRALATALGAAGLPCQLELGVHERNPATTVCFIPLAMALALAGSMKALGADPDLLRLAHDACREGCELSFRVGAVEPWARAVPFLVGPRAFELFRRVLARVSPEAIHYAEHHFGRKLAAQHRQMASDMVALARGKGVAHEALSRLEARLVTLAD